MTNSALLITTLILTLLLPTESRAQNASVLRFGLLTELSGSSAPVGIDCRNGFEAARKDFAPGDHTGAYSLQFRYEDTQGLPALGVSAFRKLVDVDKVHAVLLKRTAIGMPINPISKQAGVPILGLVGPRAFTDENPYAFRFYPTTAALGAKLAELARGLNKQRIAILSTDDDWQLAVRDAFAHSFTGAGGQAVFDERIVAAETDFAALVLRLRQSKPDAILVNLAPGQTGLFIKKLREQHVTEQIFGNVYVSEPAEIEKAGKEAVEGAILTDIALERMQSFKTRFQTSFPALSANSTVYTCYSGLALVLQTLAKNDRIIDRETLFQALLKADTVQMPDGDLPVKAREIQYELGTFRINEGRAMPYHPASVK